MTKNTFISLLLFSILVFNTSKEVLAESNFDFVERCNSCTEYFMKDKAMSAVTIDGTYNVLIFSESTNELKGYRVYSRIDKEPGEMQIIKAATQIPVDEIIINDYKILTDFLAKLAENPILTIDSTSQCPTSKCLADVAGDGYVKHELTANFILPAYFHEATRRIINRLQLTNIEAFTVDVCFGDGICVEFQFFYNGTSLSWKSTGKTSGGKVIFRGLGVENYNGSSNTNAEAGSYILYCKGWYNYYSNGEFIGTLCDDGWGFIEVR